MPPDNIALVRRWFEEVWNQRRAETIDELVTGESVCHIDEGPVRGPEEFKQRQYNPFLAAFPDLRVEIEAMIAQDDQVAVRWSATGVHRGDGLGFRATQEPVTFRGITWVQVRDGKLGEGWQSLNIPQVLHALSARAPAD